MQIWQDWMFLCVCWDISQDKCKLWAGWIFWPKNWATHPFIETFQWKRNLSASSCRGKVVGSTKCVRFIFRRPWMSAQNFEAIHSIALEMLQSAPKLRTNRPVDRCWHPLNHTRWKAYSIRSRVSGDVLSFKSIQTWDLSETINILWKQDCTKACAVLTAWSHGTALSVWKQQLSQHTAWIMNHHPNLINGGSAMMKFQHLWPHPMLM